MEEVHDVLVVGGGLAGLTAAYQLMKKSPDLKILILEAKGRVGGRTCNVRMKCGDGEDDYDIGGQWITDDQVYMKTLIMDELGLEMFVRYSQGHQAMQFGRDIMYYTKKKIPLKWLPVIKDFAQFAYKVTEESSYISLLNPETCTDLQALDSTTLEDFRKNHTWTKDSAVPLESMLACLMGCEASQIPVSFFLYYCKAAGNLLTSDRSNVYCVKGGTQSISDALRVRLGEERVILDSPVTAVNQFDDRILVETAHAQYTSRHVIIACPPDQICRIKFKPELPPEKRLLARKMVAGSYIKIIITYKEAFWRPMGLTGEFISGGGPGPLCAVFDATSHRGSAALAAFIGGDSAVTWAGREASQRRSAVLDHLVECFGPGARDVVDYVEKDWTLEPYNNGQAFPPSTGVMKYYKCLRQSAGRVHFAGTETATHCCGFMEGAVQSGVRAAKTVLYELRPEAALRNDTPLDYIHLSQDDVAEKSTNQWPVLVTCLGLAVLLAGGWLVHRTKFK